MAMHKDDLIIDIDDQVEVLLKQINSTPNHRQQRDFVESFQNMMIDQVLGPFGMSRALFMQHRVMQGLQEKWEWCLRQVDRVQRIL